MSESPGRILVVDDEKAICAVVHRTFVSLGYHVESAYSGEEALRTVLTNGFDLILTDLTMPGGIGGAELLEAIKHQAPSTDVIIMTAFPTLETAIPTLKKGAYDYLIKPFDQQFLRSAVTRCFEKRRLSSELNHEKILREELQAAYVQLQEWNV